MQIHYNNSVWGLILNDQARFKTDAEYLILKKSGLNWNVTAACEWIIIACIALDWKVVPGEFDGRIHEIVALN